MMKESTFFNNNLKINDVIQIIENKDEKEN